MTAFTIQHVSRRSALSEPTLRYYDTLQALGCLRAKAALWDARDRGDAGAEADADPRVQDVYPRLEEVVLR